MIAGGVAVAVGLATAELLAVVLPRVPSPVDAVGALIVASTPGRLVTWAIATLGSANRPVLLVSSVLVAVAIGALLGAAALRGPVAPLMGLVTAGAVGLLATMARPDAAFPTTVLVIVGALTATALVFVALLRVAGVAGDAEPAPPHVDIAASEDPRDPSVGRRGFLQVAVGTVAASLLVGTGARRLGGVGWTSAPLEAVRLPPPRRALAAVTDAQDLATRLEGVSPALTPTSSFFRIDTAFPLPSVDPRTWSLQVLGAVERPLELTYDDLLAEELVEVDATIACVSNEVGGDLIGTARWLGVPLAVLLERAGPTAAAEQLLGRSVDGWTGGFPLEVLDDGRPALVAVGMNGEPLPVRHGFPARLVVPGLFGYVSATKWLGSIELTGWDDVDGYWIPRGWSKLGPVKTGARIDRPSRSARVQGGSLTVAGVAWAPTRGVADVEVAVDGSGWRSARLVPPLSDETWVQWHLDVELAPGDHTLTVRATDGTGTLQPVGPRPPAPDGAEGWHRVQVRVG
jgi:DMSO/TMAO reductase YedYZ molybdopterin-dependent catalytic subunit